MAAKQSKSKRKPAATHPIRVLREEARSLRSQIRLDAIALRIRIRALKHTKNPPKRLIADKEAWSAEIKASWERLEQVRSALRILGDA